MSIVVKEYVFCCDKIPCGLSYFGLVREEYQPRQRNTMKERWLMCIRHSDHEASAHWIVLRIGNFCKDKLDGVLIKVQWDWQLFALHHVERCQYAYRYQPAANS